MIRVECDAPGCGITVPLAMAETSTFVSITQQGRSADACSLACAAEVVRLATEESGNGSPLYSV